MNTLVENIKDYFSKKEKGEAVDKAPEGMCAVCWGYNEWDGEYYKLVRDRHLTPGKQIYESFISKIVDKHVNTTHKHENVYICTTCNRNI